MPNVLKEGIELLKPSPLNSIYSEFYVDKNVSSFGVSTRSGTYTHVSYHLYKGTETTAYLFKFPNVTHISDTIWLAHILPKMKIIFTSL
jgi:hypothetical protein